MKPSGSDPAPSLELRGQRLCIPNLGPVFASWKQGVNPLHGRVKQAVDVRLERLLGDDGDGQVLTKIKAADLGLFASGYVTYFPTLLILLYVLYYPMYTVPFACQPCSHVAYPSLVPS